MGGFGVNLFYLGFLLRDLTAPTVIFLLQDMSSFHVMQGMISLFVVTITIGFMGYCTLRDLFYLDNFTRLFNL